MTYRYFSRIRIVFCVFLVPLLFSSCEDQIVSEDDMKEPPPAQTGSLTKFSDLQSNLFTTTCALSGCHSSRNPQAGLDLSSGHAYASLINVESELYPSMKRVIPGNSSESLLIKVLRGGVPTVMPPTGRLSPAVIDSVAAWIDRGAPND